MGWQPDRVATSLTLGAIAVLTGCGDEFTQPPQKSEDLLVVTVAFSGLLPSRTVQAIVNDTILMTIEGPTTTDPLHARGDIRLPLGSYHVRITGLDPNCEPPEPRPIRIGGYVPGFVAFNVKCRDDLALSGRGLAWIDPSSDDGWGNVSFPLSIRNQDGTVIHPKDAIVSLDAAWSENGEELAVLREGNPGLIFLSPDGRQLPGGVYTEIGAAIAWLPGESVISLLDVARGTCQILFVSQPSTVTDSLACGEPGDAKGNTGDLAWTSDGRKAAVVVGVDSSVRLVDRVSRAIETRLLPAGHTPSALEWSLDGSVLFVLARCTRACLTTHFELLRHDLDTAGWTTIASWNDSPASQVVQTLELLDADHLAVGVIAGSIHLVSLDAPGESRVFLHVTGYRLSRRP